MYTLSHEFARRYQYQVAVAGCGGTGGFTAEALCRILPASVPLVLIDPDRVEARNLGRQNFFREELGQLKSEALAKRLSREYGRAVAYSSLPVGMTPLNWQTVVIGCVDNGRARRDIAGKFMSSHTNGSPCWWIDAGNGENFGQVLIGNAVSKDRRSYSPDEQGIWRYLPLPTLQRPDLLNQLPAARSCAEMEGQGPTINQAMAALVVEVTRRLIAGSCPWIQLYLDLNLGTLQPVYATPEVVEDIVKHKINKGG